MFLTMDLPEEAPQIAAAEPQVTAKTPMPRKKKMILIISACALFVVVAALTVTLILIEAANSEKYEQAVALMGKNNLIEAKEEFLDLGGYRDSSDLAEECQNKFDYNSADTLMRSGDYAGARDKFAALGSYSNSAVRSQYSEAMVLMEAGKFEEANREFLALGDFADSKQQAWQCQRDIDYLAAIKMVEDEKYMEAQKTFTTLNGYKDSNIRIEDCRKNIDYLEAEQFVKDGKFYDAYTGFEALGVFKDAAARMAECIQTNPIPGEIYRNPDFAKGNSTFMVKSSKDEYIRCIRIYKDTTLVSTIFVAEGKQVTIKLPAGDYIIKYAVGKSWFGPDGLFGDDSDTFYCQFPGDKEGETTYPFKGGRGWWWDLRDVYRFNSDFVTVLDRTDF